jgi:hypothetical protein
VNFFGTTAPSAKDLLVRLKVLFESAYVGAKLAAIETSNNQASFLK